MYFACEKAQAREPFWPESHQSNQEQQVSHTFWLKKKKNQIGTKIERKEKKRKEYLTRKKESKGTAQSVERK